MGWTIGVRSTVGTRNMRPDRRCGPPSLLSNGFQGLIPWGKAARREADHSHPSTVEVKNVWGYTSSWHAA